MERFDMLRKLSRAVSCLNIVSLTVCISIEKRIEHIGVGCIGKPILSAELNFTEEDVKTMSDVAFEKLTKMRSIYVD